MLREAAVLAALLGLVLAVFVFVWAPHKALVVKRNHFFLKLFALFDLPPWLCRKIVPKTPARTFQGVTSSDHVFTSARDQRWAEPMSCVLVHLLTNQRWNQYRLYVPADEVDPRDALLWVHGGGFVLGSITGTQYQPMSNHLSNFLQSFKLTGRVGRWRRGVGCASSRWSIARRQSSA
jgi:acetyl esterase/lipase